MTTLSEVRKRVTSSVTQIRSRSGSNQLEPACCSRVCREQHGSFQGNRAERRKRQAPSMVKRSSKLRELQRCLKFCQAARKRYALFLFSSAVFCSPQGKHHQFRIM